MPTLQHFYNKPLIRVINLRAQKIQENCFTYLDAPVKVVGSENVPAIPLNSILEQHYLPSTEKIIEYINELLEF